MIYLDQGSILRIQKAIEPLKDAMQIETSNMLSPCVNRIYVEEIKKSEPENMSHRGTEAKRGHDRA